MVAWDTTGNDAVTGSFLGTRNAQPLAIRTSGAERMRIAPDGGISVGLPGVRLQEYKLDVGGVLHADDVHKNGAPLVGSQWDDVAGGGISYGEGDVGIGAVRSGYKLNVDGLLNATDVHKNGTPLVESQWDDVAGGGISYAGNIGVGTGVPDRPLTIQGSELVSFRNAAAATKWHINDRGGSGDLNIAETGVADGRLYLSAGGNVGIGTTNPQSRLQIKNLTAIDEGTTNAGAWANFGSNAFFDGTWRRVDTAKAGVNLHINADGAGQEFRFLRIEADGSSLRNIAVIGSNRSYVTEGNVGIGTSDPQGKLDVRGDIRAGNSDIYFTQPNHNHTGIGNAAGFAAIENAANYGALMILGRAGTSRGRSVKLWDYLQVNGGLDVTGHVAIQGRLGTAGWSPTPRTSGWGGGIHTWDVEAEGTMWSRSGYQSGNRDLAENHLCDTLLESGDVVCLHPVKDRIVLSQQSNAASVVGVVSTAPGMVLNADRDIAEEKMFPVALCGRVPCKVVDENGPIARGDLLTSSSTPGYAMKALPISVDEQEFFRPGTIIGKALEPLPSGEGVIDIFVP